MPAKVMKYLMENDDFSDSESLKRYYRKTFESKAKNGLDYFGRLVPEFDMDQKRIRKRMEATFKNIALAREMIGDAYHGYPGVVSFEKEWAEMNAALRPGYDALNNEASLIQAAALWICDTLRKNRKLALCEREILPQLSEDDLYDMQHSFFATDMNFDNEIINKVIYVITHRNDDCKVYKPKGDIERCFIDEATLRNKQFQDVPSRNTFEKLLELIGEETIDEAVNAFREKYWQLARITFEGLDKLNSRLNTQYRNYDRIAAEINSLMDSTEDEILYESLMKTALHNKGYLDPQSLELNPKMKGIVDRVTDIVEIRSLIRDLKDDREAVFDCLREYMSTSQKVRDAVFPKKLNEMMKDFRIDDPYQLSFALLYLCDRGDDLIWMYHFGITLTEMIHDVLPWKYPYDYDCFDQIREEEEKNEKSFYDALYEMRYSETYENEDEDPGFLYSAAQLMYQYTACVAPRNMSRFNFMKDIFDGYGVDEHTQQIAMTAMNFMYAADTRYESYPEETEEKEETHEQTENTEELINTYQKEISLLRKENRMLRELSHKEQKKAKQLEDKLNAQTESASADNYELARLRELAFSLQHIEETEEDSSIRFPYENRKKIVVCGGHDTFIKQMKTLLSGDVRYLNNVRINEDLIRSADYVWLQTNAISHSEYYKVINLCRKNNIPFSYFLYASARKCAEQIYLEENSEESSKR